VDDRVNSSPYSFRVSSLIPSFSPIIFSTLITFFLALVGATVAGNSGSAPAIRRLQRRGADGVRARVLPLQARGVGRTFAVFLVSFAMKRSRLLDGEDRLLEEGVCRGGEVFACATWAAGTTPSPRESSTWVGRCRREYTFGKLGTREEGHTIACG